MNIQITQKLAQQIVNTVKDVCGQDINFIECSGTILASTDEKRIGQFHEIGQKVAISKATIEVNKNNDFLGTQAGVNLPIFYKHSVIAVIGITGEPEYVKKYAHLAERITHLLIREKELASFSRTQEEKKSYVIQSLLSQEKNNQVYLETLLKELGIEKKGDKRLILIQFASKYNVSNIPIIEQKIYQLFSLLQVCLFTYEYPNRYLAVLENSIFLQKETLLQNFAFTYPQFLTVSVGKASSLFELSVSFESACTALNSISNSENNYVIFDQLTLEIITSSLDFHAKEAYLKKTLSALSEEDISLISTYFEEDMSLQQTYSKLFIHKNTLQNRLDRIYEKSGYNPRKFRDAAALYLAIKLLISKV